jgi:hypothetical protein
MPLFSLLLKLIYYNGQSIKEGIFMKSIMSKKNAMDALISLLPLAFMATVIFLGMAGISQQIIRQGANDPQIQVTQDAANTLEVGDVFAFDQSQKIDISKSLATFMGIFGENGQIISSNFNLDGKSVIPPKGVFDYAKDKGENRVTWQPEKGVRIALVVKHFDGKNPGFVISGRSMQETEKRSDNIANLVFIGWILSMISSYILILVIEKRRIT